MGLNTKDVSTGGGLPKLIEPGAQTLKINKVELTQFPFMETDNAYYLVLNVETKPIEGFDGFFINTEDESLGRYEGQIGQIKTNRFYYKDGETKGGTPVSRDVDILRQIKNICLASDAIDWFDKVDGKYDTIEEFVEAFNESQVFANKYFNITVAGKEFERKNGYIGHDLYYPKLNRGKVAIELEGTKTSKLIPYDAAEHLTKIVPVDASEEDMGGTGEDLAAPPDFEL